MDEWGSCVRVITPMRVRERVLSMARIVSEDGSVNTAMLDPTAKSHESNHAADIDTAQSIIIQPAAFDGNVPVPGMGFITDAQISQDGQNLVLKSPDGIVMVIEGYFNNETPPNLVAPDGKVLSPSLVKSFMSADAAQYANEQVSMNDASPIGEITEAKGTVTVLHQDGTKETAQKGTPLFEGDVIETSADGAANITFADESSFAVSNNARMAIDEFEFDAKTNEGENNFSMLRGIFVYTSGLVGREDPDDVHIKTPVGSIGIRGTIIAGDIPAEGGANAAKISVVEGAIVVTDNNNNQVTLSQQFETVQIDTRSGDMTNVGVLPASEMAKTFNVLRTVAPTMFTSVEEAQGENAAQTGDTTTTEGTDQPADAAADAPGADGEQTQQGEQPAEQAPEPAAEPPANMEVLPQEGSQLLRDGTRPQAQPDGNTRAAAMGPGPGQGGPNGPGGGMAGETSSEADMRGAKARLGLTTTQRDLIDPGQNNPALLNSGGGGSTSGGNGGTTVTNLAPKIRLKYLLGDHTNAESGPNDETYPGYVLNHGSSNFRFDDYFQSGEFKMVEGQRITLDLGKFFFDPDTPFSARTYNVVLKQGYTGNTDVNTAHYTIDQSLASQGSVTLILNSGFTNTYEYHLDVSAQDSSGNASPVYNVGLYINTASNLVSNSAVMTRFAGIGSPSDYDTATEVDAILSGANVVNNNSGFGSVKFSLGDGDDDYTQGGSGVSSNFISGGGGSDTFTINTGSGGYYFGDEGDDFITINGGASNSVVSGGAGNDEIEVVLSAHVYGGSGDDYIITGMNMFSQMMSNSADTSIDGGSGLDILEFTSSGGTVNLDFTDMDMQGQEITNIEGIDMGGNGFNDNVTLTVDDVFKMTENGRLFIYGDGNGIVGSSDKVTLSGGGLTLAQSNVNVTTAMGVPADAVGPYDLYTGTDSAGHNVQLYVSTDTGNHVAVATI